MGEAIVDQSPGIVEPMRLPAQVEQLQFFLAIYLRTVGLHV